MQSVKPGTSIYGYWPRKRSDGRRRKCQIHAPSALASQASECIDGKGISLLPELPLNEALTQKKEGDHAPAEK